MKIVHIITTLVYGGAEKLLSNFTQIHSAKHEIEIIYFKEEAVIESQLHPNIRIVKIPLTFNVISNVKAYLKKSNPDIIHTHLGHADFIGLWSSRNLRAKKFCTMHNIWFKWDVRDRVFFQFYRILFRWVVPKCRVISISQSVKRHVEEVLKVRPENSVLIYNSIPELELANSKKLFREELGINSQSDILLFVGRLTLQKSVDTLLYALNILKSENFESLELVIVGAGELEHSLKKLCVDLKINEVVHFVGTTPNPEKYMAASDVFILPSLFEGLGLVVLEAFRSKIPVIATNIEGPKELITDGTNGLLFNPLDVDGLVNKIKRLIEDVPLRSRIGGMGYQTYKQRFTIQSYSTKLEKLYNE